MLGQDQAPEGPAELVVLQVGGDGDRIVLKQVIRLREKTGSGRAEDGRK